MGFLLLFFLPISLHPTVSVDGNSDLIQKTCKSTKYYELCLSSLKSDSTSPKADTKDLALVMIRIGMANATAANSYLSSQMLNATNNTLMKKIIKECADKYVSASDALHNSVQDMGAELYDYAYMHVMAAADYPNACHNEFQRYPGLVYPPEIGIREDGLKQICDVVLGIIDTLGWWLALYYVLL